VLTWPNKTPLGIPIERDLFEMGKSSRNRLRIRKGVSMDELGVKIYEHFNLDETAIDQIST
jgi:hypothetical protein